MPCTYSLFLLLPLCLFHPFSLPSPFLLLILYSSLFLFHNLFLNPSPPLYPYPILSPFPFCFPSPPLYLNSIAMNEVPSAWTAAAYPSMKPLSAWSEELIDRLQFIQGDSILMLPLSFVSLSCDCFTDMLKFSFYHRY